MKTLLPLFSILLLLLVLTGSASPTARPRTHKTIHEAIDPLAHGDLPSSSYKKNRTNPHQDYAPNSQASSFARSFTSAVIVLLSVRLPGAPAGYRIRELVVVRLVNVRGSGRFVSRGGSKA